MLRGVFWHTNARIPPERADLAGMELWLLRRRKPSQWELEARLHGNSSKAMILIRLEGRPKYETSEDMSCDAIGCRHVATWRCSSSTSPRPEPKGKGALGANRRRTCGRRDRFQRWDAFFISDVGTVLQNLVGFIFSLKRWIVGRPHTTQASECTHTNRYTFSSTPCMPYLPPFTLHMAQLLVIAMCKDIETYYVDGL